MAGKELKIVTIVGDSLSMVRPDAGMNLRDLYPYKLQVMLGADYYVISRNRRANDTDTQSIQMHMNDDILHNDSKYLVIHLGIVDCAPRLITRKEYLLFRLLHINFEDNPYIRWKSKHRRFFTRIFAWQKVPKTRFKNNLSRIISSIKNETSVKKVFIVNIADTNQENKYRSFNFEKNIKEYNAVLSDIVRQDYGFCSLIDIYSESRQDTDIILDEGTHISKHGHDFIASKLFEKIYSLEKNKNA